MMQTDKAIALFEKRAASAKNDFLNRTLLGKLYLRRAEETGDLNSFAKAEEVLKAALEAKPDHAPAKTQLAITLQARHDFKGALALTEDVLKADPGNLQALAALGDSLIELGRYEEAAASYKKLSEGEQSPPVLSRLAHLDELHGRPDAAIAKLEKALSLAKDSAISKAGLAWYEMRLGGIYFSQGDLENSEKHYLKSLDLLDGYTPSLVGLAQVYVGGGRDGAAAKLYRGMIEEHPNPMMMIAYGDLLASKGNQDDADDWYAKASKPLAKEMEESDTAHYRYAAMFYADHDLEPERSVSLARKDLEMRESVQAWDTLAWTLFKSGKVKEAQAASEKALKLGTQDAAMHYHSGMILKAAGDLENSRKALAKALEINPHFSPLQAKIARETLDKIQQ